MATKRTIDLNKQSIVLEGEERIHVSPLVDYENQNYIIASLYDDVTTLYEAFLRGERVSNDGPCLGWRPSDVDPYTWISYSQVRLKAHYFGSALVEKGFEKSEETHIGIFSQNRAEWLYTDLGCMTYAMVIVPLYTTLGPEGCQYIINLTEMRLIVVDTIEKAAGLLEQIENIPTIKHIVVMDNNITDELKEEAEKVGVEMTSYQEMLELGEKNLHEPCPSKPENIACIRFTSGTTGVPKGAMTTHGSAIAAMFGIYKLSEAYDPLPVGTKSISYLPLAHAYEHLVDYLLFMHGCCVGFFRGVILELVNDIQTLKPELLFFVPRLANRLHDKVLSSIKSASWPKRMIFNMAFTMKKREVESGIVRRDSVWDSLVFYKIQELLGGNVKTILTGGAPISEEVLMFFRACFGVIFLEGYGQTECGLGGTSTLWPETGSGHVGSPTTCNMMKLVDVPEMNYWAKEDRGEICLKGPNVFKGYYKNPEKTAETIDSDGWLHTGDVGMWLPNGALKIIDRKKHIYKLAQGEYVAPEKIENVIVRSTLVSQAFVYGESLQSYNVAIIVPDEEELQKFAENNKLEHHTIEALCKNNVVKEKIEQDINKVCKAAKLCGFEYVREITIHSEPFSVENDLLTPTLKNKRTALKQHFLADIKKMYSTSN